MRYAIYYAPNPDDALGQFGLRWLGQEPCTVPSIDRVTWQCITAEPCRYGFHGTLKPPFALVESRTEAMLVDALAAFAGARQAFALPPLELARIGSFLALVPQRRCAELHALADDCVRDFDSFRAPPGDVELARRRAGGLSPRQEDLLVRWGYPYVFDEFRFHLTLTGKLTPEVNQVIEPALRGLVDPLCREPRKVTDLCLFAEPARGEKFTILRRFPLRPA